MAECPLPRTATRLSGIAAPLDTQNVGHAVTDARPHSPARPRASRPLAPAGLGLCQVPEASMTAWAMIVTGRDRAIAWMTKGASARPLVLVLSSPEAAHGRHPVPELDRSRERGMPRQGLEVLLAELLSRRVMLGIGAVPAGGSEEPFRRPVDVVLPGGEQPHMAPAAHVVADRFALFEHDRLDARVPPRGRLPRARPGLLR